MKLAIVTNILTPYRVPLFQALSGRIEDCTVLLMAEQEENRQWTFDSCLFRTEVLPGWHIKPKGAEVSLHLNYGVIRSLRRLNPDVVMSGGFAPAHLAAFAYSKLFKKRYVQWGEFTLRDGAQSSPVRRLVRRMLVGGADACVASSNEARDAFVHYGARGRPILTAPMPMEVERIHRDAVEFRTSEEYRAWRARYTGVVLLTVGRLTEAKGIRALLAMYEQVLAVRHDVSLVLVGDGPDRLLYEAYCRDHGWNQVHFIGHVDPHQLPRYLALADLFVFPTLSDTFGAVLSEAMAAELPVVASIHAAATNDLIEDGVTGYQCDPKHPATGAETILRVLALSESERMALGRAAYHRVRATDIGPSVDLMVWFLKSRVAEAPEPARWMWLPRLLKKESR